MSPWRTNPPSPESEIDSRNGYFARRGAELGVATPANQTLHARVKSGGGSRGTTGSPDGQVSLTARAQRRSNRAPRSNIGNHASIAYDRHPSD